jgi:hypothetical protein
MALNCIKDCFLSELKEERKLQFIYTNILLIDIGIFSEMPFLLL